ncbi:GntR family transcriptional regulator [Frankia sp. AgW1.1]|uniref:GntR family transcriptional regulator n=1 Tax=Frankia sp. AgW1.1 TaxID=1836971 RepID=UPI0019326B1B|nr:GntR family transcriptional regulator [Frankia sp. AgW1.1]MBL7494387.1 GntR family transcriptional regulator [Frankia sp. AgW1.1]
MSVRDDRRQYQKIAAEIRDDIATGRLRPDEPIPSLAEIQREQKVSYSTAQAVHQLLKDWGLVEARGNFGLYVLDQRPIVNHMTEMTIPGANGTRRTWRQIAADHGMIGTQQVIEVGREPIPPDVANAFGLEPNTPLVHRVRLLIADGRPAQISTSYYPDAAVAIVPRLASPEKLPTNSMQLLADAGLATVSGDDMVFGRHATAPEGVLFGVAPGEPVTEVLRVALSADGEVVSVERMVSMSARLRQVWKF